ncbi:MAG: thioredoxin family protein [Bacilli bacterium]
MNEKGKMKIVVLVLAIIAGLLIVFALVEDANQKKKLEKFNQYFNSSSEKLIYFARETCHYCTLLAPAKKAILDDNHIDYYYVDTDVISSSLLDIMLDKLGIVEFGTPTLVVVKNGKVIKTQNGVFNSETDNVSELQKFLKENNILEKSK